MPLQSGEPASKTSHTLLQSPEPASPTSHTLLQSAAEATDSPGSHTPLQSGEPASPGSQMPLHVDGHCACAEAEAMSSHRRHQSDSGRSFRMPAANALSHGL
jgi:hypothetical protein